MTTEEEIMIRLGFNAGAVQTGTRHMLDQQKRAALDYVTFWKTAFKAREEAEIAADVRSAARANKAAQLTRERAVVQAARQAAVNAEIAAGSIPANLAGKGLSKVEAGAIGAGGSVLGQIAWHIGKAVKDAFEGQWSKAGNSMLSVLRHAGGAASVLPIVGLAVTAATTAWESIQMRKAATGLNASQEQLDRVSAHIAGRLLGDVSRLQQTGKISSGEAGNLARILQHPSYERIRMVQGRLSAFGPGASDKEIEEMKRLDEQHAQKMIEFLSEDLNGSSKLTFDLIQRHFIVGEMSQLEKNSVQYKKLQLDLDVADREVLKDKADLHKEINEKAASLQSKIFGNLGKLASASAEYPGTDTLAGRAFMDQLNNDYGAGGRFDLGAGDGPFAGTAQDYERSMKQQLWDLTYGNIDQANKDRLRAMSDLSALSAAGVASPAQNMALVAQQTKDMSEALAKLVQGGATIKTKIVGVEDQ